MIIPAADDSSMEQARRYFVEGLTAIQAENWALAETAFRQSLSHVPERLSTLVNLSATLLKLGKHDEAAAVISSLLAQDPCNADALLNEGILFLDRKQYTQALERFDSLMGADPGNLQAQLNRAMALDALGRGDEALIQLDHVIAMAPADTTAHTCRSTVLFHLERFDAALSSADHALQLKPSDAQAHFCRGNALLGLRQPEHALASFELAISRRAGFAAAHIQCGVALGSLFQWSAAIEHFNQAITIDPGHAEARVQRGRALEQAGKIEAAAADYAQAIALDPAYAAAHIEQGNWYRKNKQLDRARDAYQKALDLDPHIPFMLGKLPHTKMLCCDWSGLDAMRLAVDQGVQAGDKVVDPFPYQALTASEALLGECARIFAQHWFPAQHHPLPRGRNKDKIYVGYLCGEFREQATSFLMTRVYELHDKNRFKIVAFDNGFDDGSELRRRICAAFDEVVDISRLSDANACAEIQGREIDILINLNGYFGLARPNIFAMRPSPIQVNYLGFPGTIGAPYIDYLVADETVIPPASRCHYAEQIVYLPHCYQANDARRVISSSRFTRSEFGLPDNGFVYCCFNNNYKLTPETFRGWMRILGRVEASVLWLFENNAAAAVNLRREAQRCGIAGERLIFARDLPLPQHLARHVLADLFLDTLPYNAHTTASDCLWAGLPLLTCTGDSFPGRVASSLLKALDLPQLITDSQQEYEDTAVRLAQNTDELRALRQKLTTNRQTSPLFDSARITRHLEQAYRTMHEHRLAGLLPRAFTVADTAAPTLED